MSEHLRMIAPSDPIARLKPGDFQPVEAQGKVLLETNRAAVDPQPWPRRRLDVLIQSLEEMGRATSRR